MPPLRLPGRDAGWSVWYRRWPRRPRGVALLRHPRERTRAAGGDRSGCAEPDSWAGYDNPLKARSRTTSGHAILRMSSIKQPSPEGEGFVRPAASRLKNLPSPSGRRVGDEGNSILVSPLSQFRTLHARVVSPEIVAWIQRSEIQVITPHEIISPAFTSTSVSIPTIPGFHFIPSGLRLLRRIKQNNNIGNLGLSPLRT